MPFKKILVPTDGSENTKAAVRKAMELAKVAGGSVTALYVLDQSGLASLPPTDNSVVNVYNMMKSEAKDAVDFVRDLGAEEGVEVDVVVKDGIPFKAIIEESAGYDVVVMGTLGRTGMSKFVMGSVAERVVRGAACPVMVVRAQEGAA